MKNIMRFLSENCQFLEVKFLYICIGVFVMILSNRTPTENILDPPVTRELMLGWSFDAYHAVDRFSRRQNGFVCFDVLQISQPNGVMSSAVSLPNHWYVNWAGLVL